MCSSQREVERRSIAAMKAPVKAAEAAASLIA